MEWILQIIFFFFYLMFVVTGDDVGLERCSSDQFGGRHGDPQLLQPQRRIDAVDGLLLLDDAVQAAQSIGRDASNAAAACRHHPNAFRRYLNMKEGKMSTRCCHIKSDALIVFWASFKNRRRIRGGASSDTPTSALHQH